MEHMHSDLKKKHNDLEKRADLFAKREKDFEKRICDLEKKNDDLEQQKDDLENQVTRVASENQWLKAAVADLTEQVAMLSDPASDVTTHEASASTGKPDTYTQFTSFACTSNITTISCPNSRTIFLTVAYCTDIRFLYFLISTGGVR